MLFLKGQCDEHVTELALPLPFPGTFGISQASCLHHYLFDHLSSSIGKQLQTRWDLAVRLLYQAYKKYMYNIYNDIHSPKTRRQREEEAEEDKKGREKLARRLPELGEVWESEAPTPEQR